ncbi:quinone oxidoreductase family protein [Rhodococcus opacus]|uniref:quinone oxidoreductase family protein n=1 Tax=Rhodococcus opacus TaxID=37919 RepID=UPI0002D6B6B5|nr:alcohol dehydrogenase catalytic domain-containing protein [Rhodococcus opacus]AHK31666.1 Synaptic vesicle membrane protein VAT-1 [Rhodococcus opacus PD630]UDG94200.1 alcohol dehydrogenase catalytic domain-containing protein [Rhodococcus opacus PD630]
MKAIALETYGGPDVLHPVDLPDPHPGPGQVRIQVHAAAVAPVDAMVRTGLLAQMNAGPNPPFVPGMEVAGVVDEVIDDIDPALAVAAGQKIVGFVDNLGAHGGYSDYVVLPAASVTRIPEEASAPEAASFINSMTALNARSRPSTFLLWRRYWSPARPADTSPSSPTTQASGSSPAQDLGTTTWSARSAPTRSFIADRTPRARSSRLSRAGWMRSPMPRYSATTLSVRSATAGNWPPSATTTGIQDAGSRCTV